MIFRKAEDLYLGDDAPQAQPTTPTAVPGTAPAAPGTVPVAAGPTTDADAISSMVNLLSQNKLGGNINLLEVNKAKSKLEAQKIQFDAVGEVIKTLTNSAFVDEKFEANPNPCAYSQPDVKVVRQNQVLQTFKKWEAVFKAYQVAYGNFIQALEPIRQVIEQASTNPVIINSNTYAAFEKMLAEVESDYYTKMTNYTVEARSKSVQFRFTAEQLKFKRTMAQLCVVQTKYDNDESIVGVGSRQDWMKILSLYDAAIKLASSIGNNIAGIVPDENGQILREQYANQVMIMQQNKRKYLVKPYQRLFPGAGKMG